MHLIVGGKRLTSGRLNLDPGPACEIPPTIPGIKTASAGAPCIRLAIMLIKIEQNHARFSWIVDVNSKTAPQGGVAAGWTI